MNKNIFNDYETVETALLNALATEAKTKGSKARTLKGEGYYVKYDGVEYDITAEQCRIYRLIRNNYNHFVEQLNSAKSDMLGFWKMTWGDKLPAIVADLEKAIEICQKYLDDFKSFVTEGDEVTEEKDVEKNDEPEAETTADAPETKENVETSTEETEDGNVVDRGADAHFIEADKPNGSS